MGIKERSIIITENHSVVKMSLIGLLGILSLLLEDYEERYELD